MKIATKAKYEYANSKSFPTNLIVEEEKEFDIIKVTKEIQKLLNAGYNGCIKISNIKYSIKPVGIIDSLDVAIDLSKTDLENI